MPIRRASSLSAESNSERLRALSTSFLNSDCKILSSVRSNDIQEDIVRTFFSCLAALLAAPIALAQQGPTRPVALTIYNQGFAVARTSIDLDLHAGINELTTTGVTSRLEPDSVVLRDPAGKRIINIVEQNYDAGVVNQQWLLEKYEGKTIDFETGYGQIIPGRIIRAGGPQGQPLIEVKGRMQFQLPGLPLFPSATDGLL